MAGKPTTMAGPYVGYPQVRAHFFTEGKQLVRVGKADFISLERSSQVLDDRHRDQILSVTTAKDLAAPAGRWSVTMTAGDYDSGGGVLELLRLGDVVVLEMGPDKPQPQDTWYAKNFTQGLAGAEIVMIGAVDEIREDQTFTPDGRLTRTVTVEGRDFGKFFVDDMLWWDNWGDPFSATLGLRQVVEWPKLQLFGMPSEIMRSVIDHWLFKQFDLDFHLQGRGGGRQAKQVRHLSEILRYSLAGDTPKIPWGTNLMAFEGALWNLFETGAGAPWYVLSLDVRRQRDNDLLLFPHNQRFDNQATAKTVWNTDLGTFNSQVCLTYRRNPWSTRYSDNPDRKKNETGDDWTKLPTRVITDAEVVSSRLRRSIEDVHNVWRALASVPDRTRTQSIGNLPDNLRAREQELFRRFGPRPRVLDAPFYSSAKEPGIFELVTKLTGQLRDWDIHNEHLLNGQITMKGMAAVKVGDRLWWRRDDASQGLDFYVEAVEQEFQALTSWTTTVRVTRGQLHREPGQPVFDKEGNTVRSPAAFGDVLDLTLDLGE
jgi:hypothetical protein